MVFPPIVMVKVPSAVTGIENVCVMFTALPDPDPCVVVAKVTPSTEPFDVLPVITNGTPAVEAVSSSELVAFVTANSRNSAIVLAAIAVASRPQTLETVAAVAVTLIDLPLIVSVNTSPISTLLGVIRVC